MQEGRTKKRPIGGLNVAAVERDDSTEPKYGYSQTPFPDRTSDFPVYKDSRNLRSAEVIASFEREGNARRIISW